MRRRSRRKQSRGLAARMLRAARALVLLTLAGGVLVWVGSVALRPFVLDRRETSEIRRLQQAVREAKAQNAALAKQAKTLNTAKGIEVEARRAGMVLPGEIAIQTDGTPTVPRGAKTKADPPPLGAVREGRDDLVQKGLDQASQALGGKPAPPPVAPANASKHPPTP